MAAIYLVQVKAPGERDWRTVASHFYRRQAMISRSSYMQKGYQAQVVKQ